MSQQLTAREQQARDALREALNWMEASARARTGTSAPAYRQQQRAIKSVRAALRSLGAPA